MTETVPGTDPLLDAMQARIVASLVEKEATTPDTYPLTLNAIVLACNQKTSREPVMQLEPGAVGHALRQLEGRGWVKSQHGSRADRYEHRFATTLGITRPQAALLAMLMLRGPQTVYELLTRAERMASFNGSEDVQYALERLAQREPALVLELPRQSGQRESRWAHLLSGEPELPPADATPARAAPAAAMEERIALLEARVADLEARLAVYTGRDGNPDER